MRAVVLATIAALTITTASAAQQETIGRHYHAYSAALQSGDLATAEREAAVALRMSETQDGQGGHTAVLALNLATTRLSAGHRVDALAPAQEALAIAQANPSAGVDVRLARLVETHAAFNAQQPSTAADLNSSLQAMRADDPWRSDIYSAADELAPWQFEQGEYRLAAANWTTVVATSGATADPTRSKAAAQVGLATALIMAGATQGLSPENATTARLALSEVLAASTPDYASMDPTAPLASNVRQYALALAWNAVLDYLIEAQALHIADAPALSSHGYPQTGPQPVCRFRIHVDPPPEYPSRQEHRIGIGAVVLFWRTDETGAFVRNDVVATVGADFGPSVERVAMRWRMIKADGSAEGCTMATWGMTTVHFTMPISQTRNDTLINSFAHSPEHVTGDH